MLSFQGLRLPNMLLSCLQGEPEALMAITVTGDTNHPSGHVPHKLVLGGKETLKEICTCIHFHIEVIFLQSLLPFSTHKLIA